MFWSLVIGLFPTVAKTSKVIFEAIASLLKEALSTRIGCSLLTAVAVWTAASFYWKDVIEANDQAASVKFQRQVDEADRRIRKEISDLMKKQADELASMDQKRQEEISSYDPGPPKSDGCDLIDSNLARKLRQPGTAPRPVGSGPPLRK